MHSTENDPKQKHAGQHPKNHRYPRQFGIRFARTPFLPWEAKHRTGLKESRLATQNISKLIDQTESKYYVIAAEEQRR
jgi:hypothetical protein